MSYSYKNENDADRFLAHNNKQQSSIINPHQTSTNRNLTGMSHRTPKRKGLLILDHAVEVEKNTDDVFIEEDNDGDHDNNNNTVTTKVEKIIQMEKIVQIILNQK